MQTTIKLVTVLVISAIMSSCGGSDMSNAGPKEVFKAFAERLSKKDFDGAAQLATTDSRLLINMMKNFNQKAEEKGDVPKDMSEQFNDVVIGDESINGDEATVHIKSKKEDFEMKMPMKKENGAWKVHMTANSMMNAEMKKDGRSVIPEGQRISEEAVGDALRMRDSIMQKMQNMTPEEKEQFQKMMESMKGRLDSMK